MLKLKASDLRISKPNEQQLKKIKKNPIYIILDNVMDTYNVGAIFRLADAVAAEKILLCGETETPPNSRIKKSSINTTEWVSWEYFENTIDAISSVREENKQVQIVGIEQSTKSKRYDASDYKFPIALIVGHETHGISKEVEEACDVVVEIPMWGVNISLNVMVSLGIVLFEIMKNKK